MREQLIQYVNLLFAGAPDSDDMKQEILQNTLDRYDDLIAEGKVTGTGAQSPMTIGKTIAELYYKWKAGETVEARYPIETFMINSDNIEEYNNGGWQ